MTNSCKADQTAKDTCKQAQDAGDAAPAKTGAAADAFNAVFGIKTNFAAVQEIDDQGRPVAGTGSTAAAGGNNAAAATTTSAAASAAQPALQDFANVSDQKLVEACLCVYIRARRERIC